VKQIILLVIYLALLTGCDGMNERSRAARQSTSKTVCWREGNVFFKNTDSYCLKYMGKNLPEKIGE
jgi:hypothetical protein